MLVGVLVVGTLLVAVVVGLEAGLGTGVRTVVVLEGGLGVGGRAVVVLEDVLGVAAGTGIDIISLP